MIERMPIELQQDILLKLPLADRARFATLARFSRDAVRSIPAQAFPESLRTAYEIYRASGDQRALELLRVAEDGESVFRQRFFDAIATTQREASMRRCLLLFTERHAPRALPYLVLGMSHDLEAPDSLATSLHLDRTQEILERSSPPVHAVGGQHRRLQIARRLAQGISNKYSIGDLQGERDDLVWFHAISGGANFHLCSGQANFRRLVAIAPDEQILIALIRAADRYADVPAIVLKRDVSRPVIAALIDCSERYGDQSLRLLLQKLVASPDLRKLAVTTASPDSKLLAMLFDAATSLSEKSEILLRCGPNSSIWVSILKTLQHVSTHGRMPLGVFTRVGDASPGLTALAHMSRHPDDRLQIRLKAAPSSAAMWALLRDPQSELEWSALLEKLKPTTKADIERACNYKLFREIAHTLDTHTDSDRLSDLLAHTTPQHIGRIAAHVDNQRLRLRMIEHAKFSVSLALLVKTADTPAEFAAVRAHAQISRHVLRVLDGREQIYRQT